MFALVVNWTCQQLQLALVLFPYICFFANLTSRLSSTLSLIQISTDICNVSFEIVDQEQWCN